MIKELAEQAKEKKFDYSAKEGESRYSYILNEQKFAELVVEKTIDYINNFYVRNFGTLWRDDLSQKIRQHFGLDNEV